MIESVRPASPTRRLLLVVAIPSIILLLGGWQIVRGVESVAEFSRNGKELAAALASVEAVVAQSPSQVMRFRGDPVSYSASAAAQRLRDANTNVGWEELAARVRLGLAAATAGGAALGLLAGFTGLLAAAWAERQSRRSRAAVEAAFSRVRLMLPWILGGQIGGLTLALGGGALFELIGLVLYGELGNQTGRALQWGLAFTGVPVWLGWVALRELRRSLRAFIPEPMQIFGRVVQNAEAPGLWRMIEEVARTQGAAGPEHVVVGLVDGFFVTSSDVDVQPGRERLRGRTLHLPLPQLAMLDADETRAVIAHELAHFAGDDTVYSTRFLPIYAGIARNLSAIGLDDTTRWTQAPAMFLGTHIMAVFDRAVKHWSRVRELEADAASRLFAGPHAPACALIRTKLISSVTDRVMGETVARPRAAGPDLVEAMLARAAQDGFADPASALSDRQPHPTDTHPPTRMRIEALGLPADQGLLARAARAVRPEELESARSLFADWEGLCRVLSADAVAFATAQDKRLEDELRHVATQRPVAETQVFQEVRGLALRLWLPGLFFGSIGLLLSFILIARAATDLTTLLSAGFCLLVGALVLGNAVHVMRSRHSPYLTLTADGFVCRGLDRMVPWLMVERVNLVTVQPVNLFFHLNAMTRLPPQPPQPILFRTTSVHVKRRVIAVTGKPRGMKPEGLLELVGRYLSAAQAQAALDGRGRDQLMNGPVRDEVVARPAGIKARAEDRLLR